MNRNPFAELAERLDVNNSSDTIIRIDVSDIIRAQRIIAELAKVQWWKANNGDLPFYQTSLSDIMKECRAIAEE